MFAAEGVSYKNTNSFNPIVLDYLEGAATLLPFYSFTPNLAGIEQAINAKKNQPVNRVLLTQVLHEQYKDLPESSLVVQNIQSLLSVTTFTICTAHQPNLFTGPLYFIYKILHAIKLAEHLQKQFSDYRFVPVYYMGCEDADLEELNHIYVDEKKYEWTTLQKGAVGRMFVDAKLVELIDELHQQIGITTDGKAFIELLRQCYTPGCQIKEATLRLVHALFHTYGLIVIVPDDARLKAQMIPVFLNDLFENKSSHLVAATSQQIGELYNAQAYSRDINLFYLKDSMRERIEEKEGQFRVLNSAICFTPDEIRQEVRDHPERFSPNVILRGLYQETILPNVAFIGGGGELAYWLQLKHLFAANSVAFPVLLLRNSFLIMDQRWKKRASILGLLPEELFLSETDQLNLLIAREGKEAKLNGELKLLAEVYDSLKEKIAATHPTIRQHIEALKTNAVKRLSTVEEKLQRAERKKRVDSQAQLSALKAGLFPGKNLQERVENVAVFYTKWGHDFIDALYENSPPFAEKLVILERTSET
ncbi:MAG: bacillithiol biosynthesis cysteine-adding enzyme BshC [Chitinophagaceae bacterium]